MNVYDARALALAAVAAHPARPATSILHDSADGRIVLFRIEPGQAVPLHSSVSSVFLVVLSGSGTVSGSNGDRAARAGDIVAYAPQEPHGMRATDVQMVIAALIAPRPSGRA